MMLQLKIINTDNIMMLGQQKVNDSTFKRYTTIPVINMQSILTEILSIDNHLIPPSQPINPYFDLDFETTLSKEDGYKLVIIFLEIVNAFLKELYNVNIEIEDWLLLDSYREGKLSYHIIGQNKIYFSSVLCFKTFTKKLESKFIEEKDTEVIESLSWTTAKGEKNRYIFDLAPYSYMQCFRLIDQSKKTIDFSHTLKSHKKIDFISTLIRLYNGTNDRVLINEVEYGTKIIKPKTEAKKDTICNSKRLKSEYRIDGNNLMDKKNLPFDDLKLLPEYQQFLYLIPNKAQSLSIFKSVG